MSRASLTFPPRLLGAPQAAAYLGISAETLRKANLPRVSIGARRLYDRLDLDAFADTLPREGRGESIEVNTCDEAWG